MDKKTEDMNVSLKKSDPQRQTTPVYDGQRLSKVCSHKHLGAIISSDLSGKNHVKESVKKAHMRVNILSYLKYK